MASRRPGIEGVRRAVDEARFGPQRTLNLRDDLPTADDAAERVERWLRAKQVERASELLIVTGRGNNSEGGVSPVREAVRKRIASLRRQQVVAEIAEHTPGSFVVRPAPLRQLFEAPPRRRENEQPPEPDPRQLLGLRPETRAMLRSLAERTIDRLGVRAPTRSMMESEMIHLLSALSQALTDARDREFALRAAIVAALDELEQER